MFEPGNLIKIKSSKELPRLHGATTADVKGIYIVLDSRVQDSPFVLGYKDGEIVVDPKKYLLVHLYGLTTNTKETYLLLHDLVDLVQDFELLSE